MTTPTTPGQSPGPRRMSYPTQVLVAILVALALCFVIFRIVEHHDQNAAAAPTRDPSAAAQKSYADAIRADPLLGATAEYSGASDDQLAARGYKLCDDIDNRGMDAIMSGGGPDDTARVPSSLFLAATQYLCPADHDEVAKYIDDHPDDFS